MRKADLQARIKKIEIVNRVLSDGWAQSIRVILEDIALSNENLLELKQFLPNESVMVEISPLQVSMFDSSTNGVPQGFSGSPLNGELSSSVPEHAVESSLAFSLEEGDHDDPSESVVQEWVFNA